VNGTLKHSCTDSTITAANSAGLFTGSGGTQEPWQISTTCLSIEKGGAQPVTDLRVPAERSR